MIERTVRAGEDVPQAYVQKKELQYLYRDGDGYVFMDSESYEQLNVSAAVLGDDANWVKEGESISVLQHEGRIVGIELPASVVLEVTATDPGLAGNTVQNATKPATLETGAIVQVPLFIEPGTKIKVDTRSGQYLSRG